MRPQDKIKLEHLLNNGPLAVTDVVYIMSVFRTEIESKKSKIEYALLNMYCDWMLHETIDLNMRAYDLALKLTRIIVPYASPSAPSFDPGLFMEIEDTVIESLRQDLARFTDEAEITTQYFDESKAIDRWPAFFYLILIHLLDRRLGLPADVSNTSARRASGHHQQILYESRGTPLSVAHFYFSEGPRAEGYSDSGYIHWNLECPQFGVITGPLYMHPNPKDPKSKGVRFLNPHRPTGS